MIARRQPRAAPMSAVSRRLLGRLLLAFALLWSQQAAIAHAIGHLPKHSRAASKSLLPDPGCVDCLAYAQLCSAVGIAAHALALGTYTAPLPGALITDERCLQTEPVFEPRAPPPA